MKIDKATHHKIAPAESHYPTEARTVLMMQSSNPRSTWSNHDDYDAAARGLAQKFVENFRKFNVDDDITNAGPQLN